MHIGVILIYRGWIRMNQQTRIIRLSEIQNISSYIGEKL